MIRLAFVFSLAFLAPSLTCGEDLTADQNLILACHRLEVNKVVELLRSGANVEGKFGKTDTKKYSQDQWTGGWPMSASQWTPLHALARSSPYPAPPKGYHNTVEHLNWAREKQKTIPKEEIELRSKRRVQILNILLSHGCDINVADNRGATPLYAALSSQHENMVQRLLDFKPNVNTKTGVYVDGAGDITPLHQAYWSPELTQRLIEMGANDEAKDSTGRTPKDWRRRYVH